MKRRPRVHVHDDGQFVSIGFDDTNDTLLKVGGQNGPAGAGDVDRVRQWAEQVTAIIDAYADIQS